MDQPKRNRLTQKRKPENQDNFSSEKSKLIVNDIFKMICNKSFILFAVFIFFAGIISSAQKAFDDKTKDPEIGIVEHLDEFIPTDIYLIDRKSVV